MTMGSKEKDSGANGLEMLLGINNADTLKHAKEAIQVLQEAGALNELWNPKRDQVEKVSVEHTGDVSSDTDKYKVKKEEQEDFGEVVGWMIPFEIGGQQAFAVIDYHELSTSIHFIDPTILDVFKKTYRDEYTNGKRVELRPYDSVEHLHFGGLFIPCEDKPARLVATNLDKVDKIQELLKLAITQSKEVVIKSREARQRNSQATQTALSDFLGDLLS